MNQFIQILMSTIDSVNISEPTLNPSTSDVVLVFDGNSLTSGTNNAGIEQYYPKEVNTHFTNTFNSKEFYSYGVGGQTTQDMMSDAATQIYPKAKAGKTNILIAWESENSLLEIEGKPEYGQSTAQENFDDFVTYFQNAKNAGFQYCIHITGYYPRLNNDGRYQIGTNIITPESVDKMEVFMNMVTNADINSVPWDYHIDLRNAPNIGGAKGQLRDNTYFSDYLHLEAAGYDIVASYVIAEINKIFGI